MKPNTRRLNKARSEAAKFRPFRLSYTDNALANLLNGAIEKCFKERKFHLSLIDKNEPSALDYDTVNMLAQDAKDLREIRNHIIKGRMDLAGKKTYGLDTAVYELIPSKLYNILQEYGA